MARFTRKEENILICDICGRKLNLPLGVEKEPNQVHHICRPKEYIMPKKKCGTILKNMLAKFGIKQEEGCACGHIETEMNDNGPEWCEAKLDYLVGRISKEATKRKLPVTDWLIKQFVRRAIRKCKAK